MFLAEDGFERASGSSRGVHKMQEDDLAGMSGPMEAARGCRGIFKRDTFALEVYTGAGKAKLKTLGLRV